MGGGVSDDGPQTRNDFRAAFLSELGESVGHCGCSLTRNRTLGSFLRVRHADDVAKVAACSQRQSANAVQTLLFREGRQALIGKGHGATMGEPLFNRVKRVPERLGSRRLPSRAPRGVRCHRNQLRQQREAGSDSPGGGATVEREASHST